MRKAPELTEEGVGARAAQIWDSYRLTWDDIKLTSQETCILRVIPARNHDEQIYETNLDILVAQGRTLVQPVSPGDTVESVRARLSVYEDGPSVSVCQELDQQQTARVPKLPFSRTRRTGV